MSDKNDVHVEKSSDNPNLDAFLKSREVSAESYHEALYEFIVAKDEHRAAKEHHREMREAYGDRDFHNSKKLTADYEDAVEWLVRAKKRVNKARRYLKSATVVFRETHGWA